MTTERNGFQLDPLKTIAEQVAELPYDLNWEFPRLDISLEKIIGEGKFGEVWEAIAEGIAAFKPHDQSELAQRSKLSNLYVRGRSENDFWVKYFRKEYYPPEYSQEERVAVKCLKPGASEQERTDLESELKLMIHIGGHKNIVNLLGACTLKGPLLVILEYCPQKDLKKFIRNKELLPMWDRIGMTPKHLCFLDIHRICTEVRYIVNFPDGQ